MPNSMSLILCYLMMILTTLQQNQYQHQHQHQTIMSTFEVL